MLSVEKPAPNRLDITLSGELDAIALETGLEALVEAAEGIEHGVMLYRIPDFEMPTLGAFGVEMRFLPSLFRLVARFDRCAVVTPSAWLRTAAEVEGVLIPGLAIRAFEPGQEAAAEAWLNAEPWDAV